MNKNIHNCVDCLKAETRIKVADYRGFWSVFDDLNGYVILEHNTYGDETCYLVVKAKEFVWKDIKMKSGAVVRMPVFESGCTVYETYDDIETCLTDENII